MMAWPTIICGLLLVADGAYGYGNATPKEDGSVSPTALIPAAFGVLLVVCGLLAFRPNLRKHVMHFAAMIGLLGVIGGVVPIVRQVSAGKELNLFAPAVVSGLVMSLVCAVFVALCVKSFVDARKARTAAGVP